MLDKLLIQKMLMEEFTADSAHLRDQIGKRFAGMVQAAVERLEKRVAELEEENNRLITALHDLRSIAVENENLLQTVIQLQHDLQYGVPVMKRRENTTEDREDTTC